MVQFVQVVPVWTSMLIMKKKLPRKLLIITMIMKLQNRKRDKLKKKSCGLSIIQKGGKFDNKQSERRMTIMQSPDLLPAL